MQDTRDNACSPCVQRVQQQHKSKTSVQLVAGPRQAPAWRGKHQRRNSEPVVPSWEYVAYSLASSEAAISSEEHMIVERQRRHYHKARSLRATIPNMCVGTVVEVSGLLLKEGGAIKGGTPDALFGA
eukprot:TRINITY_DN1044_c0_g1_i8.p2 TRINITY_DN1044_c0_g1~~TRINITY_DN1044_c0_g1_i8.p2  ORF type:complete len:137 (+),score=34.79 TRINITY_DN1044_c0_g1_i8:33-413(+)